MGGESGYELFAGGTGFRSALCQYRRDGPHVGNEQL
jgi:hypothetical protein